MPSTPTIPQNPGRTANSPGKYLFGSGTVPASGLATGLSGGPWMIETQDLTINYVRVPHYSQLSATHSLSGPARSMTVTKTRLEQVVRANYRVRQSHEYFSTSSWTEPQTFQYDAQSTDQYGNSYGDLSAGASGTLETLGPQGTVNTKVGWYFRRPWNHGAADVEVAQECQGTRHYYFTAGTDSTWWTGACPGTPVDGTTYFGSFPRSGHWAREANTFLDGSQESSFNRICFEYELLGPYGTHQETSLAIANYINAMGDHVTNTLLLGVGANFIGSTGVLPTPNQGCAGYDISRHSWVQQSLNKKQNPLEFSRGFFL